MAKGMNWAAQQHRGRPTEAARPKSERRRGAWTHVKQEPVRKFTDAEKAQWAAANPNLLVKQVDGHARRTCSYDQWHHRAAVEKVIADIEPNLFVTLVFNSDVPFTRARAKLLQFFARMDRKTVGCRWLERPEERAIYVAIAENVDSNLHFHIAARIAPQHRDKFVQMAAPIWSKLAPSGSVDIQRVWGLSGMADYMTKQITPERADRLLLSGGAENRLY